MVLVAAVAYCVVVTPVGVGIAACQVIASRRAIQTGVAVVRIPWAVIGVSTVPTARAPSEEINIAAVGRRDVAVGTAYIVILVGGETPCAIAGLVLQVALREIHALACAHGEHTIYRTSRCLRLSCKVGHQTAITSHREGIVGICGDLVAVLRPLLEVVTRCCRRIHRTRLPLLIGATSCNGSSVVWVGRNTNSICRRL